MAGLSYLDQQLPPGFRFNPTDEELIVHYLQNKVTSRPMPVSLIADIDLYKFDPWDLPSRALFGENEWFFFSPRDRKYPNGARPNRAAASGYWKATGTDKPILASCGNESLGVKKGLVFYKGRPPKGIKTDWIMHEYRLPDSLERPERRSGSMRLDDWVLCRVRHKFNAAKNIADDRDAMSADTLTGFYEVGEQQILQSKGPDLDVASNIFQSSFPALEYILASVDPFDACSNSSMSFQGSSTNSFLRGPSEPESPDKNVHSPHIHSPHIHSPHIHSPQIHSPHIHSPQIHSPLKRCIQNESRDGNVYPFSKKLNFSPDAGFGLARNDQQFCDQSSFHDQSISNPILEFQQLFGSMYTGNNM
ncbi:NAC domain-containing protein 67 [Amborella trichopoda]|uniref:NAC domain-containing protein n=1 Tax=Amborella trichopoda TaxID=13333 RepID=W1P5U3_AMBTC|nr:NAC domain-containing protein 67 [Amborella trichopoda]ERN05222.1 hypothetical protein AMTR_s00007p00063550 [Amborella trichopoda]|eukprot:XP_006843547.1 NAC domain-containing protein 67 [Amborella trichopoda]